MQDAGRLDARLMIEECERLLLGHDAAGSPLRSFLRIGAPRDLIDRTFRSLALDPPPALVDLYAWRDGIDQEAWAATAPGTAMLNIAPYTTFPSLAEAAAQYQEIMVALRQLESDYPESDDDEPFWRSEWFPALDGGHHKHAVICGGSLGGSVRKRWLSGGHGSDYPDLEVLFDTIWRRLQSGDYFWDHSRRMLMAGDGVPEA